MSEKKYNLILCIDDNTWDSALRIADTTSLFFKSRFISLVDCEFDRFLIYKGDKLCGGLLVLVDRESSRCVLNDLVIHNGLFFITEKSQKQVRRLNEQFEITQEVVLELSRRYTSVVLALAPQINDIRPFLWHKYHDPEPSGKYTVSVRYTTYIDTGELASGVDDYDTLIFSNMDTLRQRHIRKARAEMASVRRSENIKRLLGYYKKLLEGQGKCVDDSYLEQMGTLMHGLQKKDIGCTYEVRDREGEILYIMFYAWDEYRGYYLFGAGNPDSRKPWQGTVGHWEVFRDLAVKRGIYEIDLEGVNSPQRGWFKLSFGGRLVSYLEISNE